MPVNWMDVTSLSFNNLLLLERVQLSWFPGWLPEPELAIALRANPFLVSKGFHWSCFEEPHIGLMRKYWKTKENA
jgi:hypothetical protein